VPGDLRGDRPRDAGGFAGGLPGSVELLDRALDEAGLPLPAETFRGVYRIMVPESCVFFRWEFPEEWYAIDLPPLGRAR
jgi:hypothetical protein